MTTSEEGVPGLGLAVERTQRVAVFVDVENVLGWLKRGGCTELLGRAHQLGVVSIRRAFGDFSNRTVASRQVELQRHGFDLVHTLHPARGKSNSADISMTIDVMESCRGPDIQWVMLATGDSDFGPVFRRLRELGKGVVGVGPSSVLSSSVALSCHEFIFTDDDRNRSGSAKKRRGRAAARADRMVAGAGAAGTITERGKIVTRVATPPQLLSARGGFRFERESLGGDGVRSLAAIAAASGVYDADNEERGITTRSPLLIDGPIAPPPPPPPQPPVAMAGKGVVPTLEAVDWTVIPPPSTPPLPPPPPPPPPPPSSELCPQLDLSSAFAKVALTDTAPPPTAVPAAEAPVLSPGQLLLPGMVTAAAMATSPAAGISHQPAQKKGELPVRSSSVRDMRNEGETRDAQQKHKFLPTSIERSSNLDGYRGKSTSGEAQSRGGQSTASTSQPSRPPPPRPPPPPLPQAFDNLGALSVIRPSEKLYRHLLAVGTSSSAGAETVGGVTGSLASEWDNDLSEVAVAKGLVSLAEACKGQDSEHSRAVETLCGFSAHANGGDGHHGGSGCGPGPGAGEGEGVGLGLGREEAFRVAGLLQRCGFLSWVAKEQQWVVTVPADVDVLRRRRDEVMMEELLTRCQEAGVPFEPSLAASLLWSKAR